MPAQCIYPWTIENGTQSVLHLKNTTGNSASALLMLEFPGGKLYNPPRIVLQPYQSVAIDIQKLKNSKTRDVLKRAFPANATHGQVQWRQEIPYSMIGRLERTNVAEGIARSFSCGSFCCGNFSEDAYVNPGSASAPIGTSFALQARVKGTDCNAVPFDNPATGSVTWSSQNSNVATVDSSGNVTMAGMGSTTIVAKVTIQQYIQVLSKCQARWTTQNVNVSVTAEPRLDSISPPLGPIGATTSVTFSGQGFGTSPSVNAGSGITVTISPSPKSDTQFQASLAISSSATGGNRSISVTAAGQTSPTLNFYVQIPTYFFSPSAAQTSMPPPCVQAGYTGYFINVSYYVAAQNSSQVSQSGIAPGENLGDGVWHDAFATPTTTRSDGSFNDTPNGSCFSTPVHHCETIEPQSFRLTNNGTVLSIATNTTRRACTDGIQLVIQGNPSAQNKTYTFGNTQ